MSDEQQIAALREEIRRAGAAVRALRAWTFVSAAAACLLFVAWRRGVNCPDDDGLLFSLFLTPGYAGSLLLSGLLLALAVGALAGVSLAWCFRALDLVGLRRRSASLDAARAGELLTFLQTWHSGDVRKLARSLQQCVACPAELAPATAPDARGDEASPAERTP